MKIRGVHYDVGTAFVPGVLEQQLFLIRTGKIEANLVTLNEEFGLP